jgi:Xaa-Pro dipeptidase
MMTEELLSQQSVHSAIAFQLDPERVGTVRRFQDAALKDHDDAPDMDRMAHYRYARLQQQIIANDCAGALIINSINLRYATDTHYAQGQGSRGSARAVFVPAEGPAVLYDWAKYTFGKRPDFVGEYRDSFATDYFISGASYADCTKRWADNIVDLVRSLSFGTKRLAIDHCEPELAIHIANAGIEIVNAEKLIERAGAIKSDDELYCMAHTAAIAESGLARIRGKLRPGISEQELWSELAHENARHGNGWFDYCILASGRRTNPWGGECSDKLIGAGELVGVDTGMIGPFGYCADISRTFFCAPDKPDAEQRHLYQVALENLSFNIEIIRAGMSFREFAEKSWPVPEEFWSRRYNSIAHGVGMGNEWPLIPFRADSLGDGDDEQIFEENMVLAIETCIGREDGIECVKLEDMIIVRAGKCQLLSTFPYEDALFR